MSEKISVQPSEKRVSRALIYGPTTEEVEKMRLSLPLIDDCVDEFTDLKTAKQAILTGRYSIVLACYTSLNPEVKSLLDLARNTPGCVQSICAAQNPSSVVMAHVWDVGKNHLFTKSKSEVDDLTIPLHAMFSDRSPAKWFSNLQSEFQRVRWYREESGNNIVLIIGAQGTAKYTVAQIGHLHSDRNMAPFVFVNCKLPERHHQLLWDEKDKGFFTNNINAIMENADHGTLYFHEIDHLDIEAQEVLADIFKSGKYTMSDGKGRAVFTGVIVCSMRQSFEEGVENETISRNLIQVISRNTLTMPSLHEFHDDIPTLARELTEHYCMSQGKEVKSLSNKAIQAIINHVWTRNIRELFKTIKDAINITPGKRIPEEAIRILPHFDLTDNEREQKSNVRLALKQTNGNVAKAANMLEVSRKTLYVWMSKHGIEKGFGKKKKSKQ